MRGRLSRERYAVADPVEHLASALRQALPGVARTELGLESPLPCRYGDLTVRMDWDREAGSIRVYVRLSNPPGGGAAFLAWCLSINTLYWDVKIALDGDGMLLVCADVDWMDLSSTGANGAAKQKVADRARTILERLDTIRELVDDDLVPYLRRHRLGTPAQLERWRS